MKLLPLLFVINLYFAWRYYKTNIDPDLALFNMAGQVGSWYGRDFVDCKSPGVHIYFYILGKLFGSISNVRFVHHLITGLPGIIYTIITNDFWGGLIFTILIHSGFLLTFHGNVGDIPAGLILLALVVNQPWLAVSLFVIAVLYEPKLIVAFLPWVALNGFWLPSVIWLGIGAILAGALWYFKHDWFEWLIEANITIPKRMNENRKGVYTFMPHFTANVFVYVGMWMGLAILTKPDIKYWIPALCFLAFQFFGNVIRPNHLIPLIPFIALSGMNPYLALILIGVDLLSAGLYLGDIWLRFYPGLRNVISDSRQVGEWLKDKPGTLWLNSMYSEIYIWSGKAPQYGMTEQIEISSVASERRAKMRIAIAHHPPDWVVDQPGSEYVFDNKGYKPVAQSQNFVIYRKEI